jgi:hypothetical protein
MKGPRGEHQKPVTGLFPWLCIADTTFMVLFSPLSNRILQNSQHHPILSLSTPFPG